MEKSKETSTIEISTQEMEMLKAGGERFLIGKVETASSTINFSNYYDHPDENVFLNS